MQAELAGIKMAEEEKVNLTQEHFQGGMYNKGLIDSKRMQAYEVNNPEYKYEESGNEERQTQIEQYLIQQIQLHTQTNAYLGLPTPGIYSSAGVSVKFEKSDLSAFHARRPFVGVKAALRKIYIEALEQGNSTMDTEAYKEAKQGGALDATLPIDWSKINDYGPATHFAVGGDWVNDAGEILDIPPSHAHPRSIEVVEIANTSSGAWRSTTVFPKKELPDNTATPENDPSPAVEQNLSLVEVIFDRSNKPSPQHKEYGRLNGKGYLSICKLCTVEDGQVVPFTFNNIYSNYLYMPSQNLVPLPWTPKPLAFVDGIYLKERRHPAKALPIPLSEGASKNQTQELSAHGDGYCAMLNPYDGDYHIKIRTKYQTPEIWKKVFDDFTTVLKGLPNKPNAKGVFTPSGLIKTLTPEIADSVEFTSKGELMKLHPFGKEYRSAISKLLDYYQKVSTPEEVDRLSGAFEFAWFKDHQHIEHSTGAGRPCEDATLIWSFPRKYVDALPDLYGQLTKQERQAMLASASHTVHFEWSTFEANVAQAAGLMMGVANKLGEEVTGNMPGSWQGLAKKVKISLNSFKAFAAIMKDYLELNGFSKEKLEKHEYTVTFGMDENFFLKYVLINKKDWASTPIMVGFDGLINLPDVWQNPSLLHYVKAMDHIIYSGHFEDPDISAIETVQKYYYPCPPIYPSKQLPAAKTSPQADPEIHLSGTGFGWDHRGGPRSEWDWLAEKRTLTDPKYVQTKYGSREFAIDFTGDKIVQDITFLSLNLNSGSDVMRHVLNRTNMIQLGKIAMQALMCSLDNNTQQKLLAAQMIASAANDCIAQIAAEVKLNYPNSWEKAYAMAEKAMEDEAPPPNAKTVAALKQIEKEKAARSPLNNGEIATGSPMPGSGADIYGSLPATEKSKVGNWKTYPEQEGTIATTKRALLNIANDASDIYKIGGPMLMRIVGACIPDAKVKAELNQLFLKGDKYRRMIPPRPPALKDKGPRANVPSDQKTADPDEKEDDLIAEGMKAILKGALVGTCLLLLTTIKKGIDEGLCADHVGAAPPLPASDVADAFGDAGIDQGLGLDFYECLASQLTPMELNNLMTQGVITETVMAAIKFCADANGLGNDIPMLKDGILNLGDRTGGVVPPEPVIEPPPEPPDSGLLCDDEDDSAEQSKERSDKFDTAKAIADIMKNANALLDMPPVFGDCGRDGMLPKDSESDAAMNSMVIDAIFAAPKMAFNSEAGEFVDTLIIKETKPAEPGDIDYIGPALSGETDADDNPLWEDPQTGDKMSMEKAEKINQKNSKPRSDVHPWLKEDLMDTSSFTWETLLSETEQYYGKVGRVRCSGRALKPVSETVSMETLQLVSNLQEEIDALKNELKSLIKTRDLLEKNQTNPAFDNGTHPIYKKIAALNETIKSKQKTRDAAAKLIGLAEAMIPDGSITPDANSVKQLYSEIKGTLEYILPPQVEPYIEAIPENGSINSPHAFFSDRFIVNITEEGFPLGEYKKELYKHNGHWDIPVWGTLVDGGIDGTLFGKPLTKYDEGAPSQANSFANHIVQGFADFGISKTASTPNDVHKALTAKYGDIFISLLQNVARQIGSSPLFDIKNLQELNFSPTDDDPCDPKDHILPDSAVDLLGLNDIKDTVHEDYNQTCTPPDLTSGDMSPMENAARVGVIRLTVRLYMLETMMKSIFTLSEFRVEDIMKDPLVLKYLVHRMEDNLGDFNSGLFNHICLAASDYMDERIAKHWNGAKRIADTYKEIVPLGGVLNLEKLLKPPPKGGRFVNAAKTERGKEVLKFLALEQVIDLSEKLEEIVGSNTANIDLRFLNPPQNSPTPKLKEDIPRDTPAGFPVQIPTNADSGWIRTIDVPVASNLGMGDDHRFIAVNEYETSTKWEYKPKTIGNNPYGDEKQSGTFNSSWQDLLLRYPDLASSGGTFFLERYIRVEDRTAAEIKSIYSNDTDVTGLGIDKSLAADISEIIRTRHGGPDNAGENILISTEIFDSDYTGLEADHQIWKSPPGTLSGEMTTLEKAEPHLSGVVNLAAFREWIDKLYNTATAAMLDASKSSLDVDLTKYFKSLKWGLRLVWVPPMSNNKPTPLVFDSTYDNMGYKVGDGLNTGWIPSYDNDIIGAITKIQTGAGIKSPLEEVLYTMTDIASLKQVSIKEKAFDLTESQIIKQASKTMVANVVGDMTIAKSLHTRSTWTLPLLVEEQEIDMTNMAPLEKFHKWFVDDPGVGSKHPLGTLRQNMIESEKYAYLFKYVFSLPRMLSLATIYNANSITLSTENVENAFNNTKGALRNLFYTLSPKDEQDEWWNQKSIVMAQDGGSAGIMDKQQKMSSPSFSVADLIMMQLRTVPLIVRGMAEYLDPHYALISKLSDYGVLPTGKTWASVPIFWPVNMMPPPLVGWGPPLTGYGIAAYSMPLPKGDKAGAKKAHDMKKLQESNGCEDLLDEGEF